MRQILKSNPAGFHGWAPQSRESSVTRRSGHNSRVEHGLPPQSSAGTLLRLDRFTGRGCEVRPAMFYLRRCMSPCRSCFSAVASKLDPSLNLRKSRGHPVLTQESVCYDEDGRNCACIWRISLSQVSRTRSHCEGSSTTKVPSMRQRCLRRDYNSPRFWRVSSTALIETASYWPSDSVNQAPLT